MKFDDITGDGRLWAVKYEGDCENILTLTFRDWNDFDWLEDFFRTNAKDLEDFFHITHTMQERAHTLQELSRMETVRNFLIEKGATDLDGFYDYLENEYETDD